MAIPDLTVTGIDWEGKVFTDTLKFDGANRPIFDAFLSDGTKIDHGLHLLYELFRTSSLHDVDILSILDRLVSTKLTYANRVAIVNGIVGTVLDMWLKKGHFYQMDSILKKIKTVQADVLAEAAKEKNRNTGRIEEMDRVIKSLTARDAKAAQIQHIEGR